jgi:hypothetical protein
VQECLSGFTAQKAPTRAAQIECADSAPKLCTKPLCSPQLGDYRARVHLAQSTLSQPEMMLRMPLDGERTAENRKRRKAASQADARHLLAAREHRKNRKAAELAHSSNKANPEPGSPEAIALRLVNVLGITPTLARFAAAFARNLKLRPACADIGVGYETGRTYLKQIFHKTGTHSQAELAVLLVGVLGDG